MLLELNKVGKRFGGLVALSDITFSVAEKEVYGVIGPNGAGKTTLFNLITGVFPPTEGSITLAGTALTEMPPHRIVERGIARTFQNIRLFPSLSALENVMTGLHTRLKSGLMAGILQTKAQREEEVNARKKAQEWLAFVGLENSGDWSAEALAYGQQRRLEIARALASEPRLLLLDEPAAGMNDSETAALRELIGQISALGVTVVLIEHDMNLVMQVCDRLAVLNFGKQIAEGTPDEVRSNPAVVEAYLGKEEDDA